LIKFENGASITVTGGNNIGRVGILQSVEKHPGSFDIAHVKDAEGNVFATRLTNIFAIGEGKKQVITLLPGRGIKKTPQQERDTKQRHHD
jgi:small subunit ribosomal protein S4e